MKTIEEKAKAYDEALKVAKGLYAKGAPDSLHLEKMFPVLKESEDEKIRKEMIFYFTEEIPQCSIQEHSDKMRVFISWLKKQEVERTKLELKAGSSYFCYKSRYERADNETFKKGLIYKCNKDGVLDNFVIKNPEQHFIEIKDERIAWLEKQGDQKTDDRVESKFHEGEWINNGDYTWKIVEVKPLDYILQSQDGNIVDDTISHVDEQFHSFTIQDAKDGDVLTCYSDIKGQPIEQTGIIKQYVGRHGGCSNSFKAHFGVDWDNNVVIEGYMGSSNISPATKEQRDLLFQKMKEEGYEWDADKKELKKIEQKPNYCHHEVDLSGCSEEYCKAYYDGWNNCNQQHAQFEAEQKSAAWNEEDEKNSLDIKRLIGSYRAGKAEYRLDSWIDSLKDRVQPKQEWSEEDKRKIDRIYSVLWQAADTHAFSTTCRLIGDKECVELQDFLKSLRPQNTWKPSDEQMYNLSEAAHLDCVFFDMEILIGLYDDLKKLMDG